jgi:hypothetical protein
MTDKAPPLNDGVDGAPGNNSGVAHEDALETYGDGSVSARHGGINRWLLVVYAVLFVWALYYAFTYWGGLGPGLDY